LIRLQLQFAIAKYLIGKRLYFESEFELKKILRSKKTLSPNNSEYSESPQQLIVSAIERFKTISDFLVSCRNLALAEQINFLSDEVNLYLYCAEFFYAASFQPDNNNRNDKLNRIVLELDNWSKKKLESYSYKSNLTDAKIPEWLRKNYYQMLQARVKLAACYRLAGEFDKSLNTLNVKELDSNDVNLPENLRLQIAAERIRFLIVSSINVTINKPDWNTADLLNLRPPISSDSLDYCQARLEWALYLTSQMKITDSSSELIIISDLFKLVRSIELYVPSGGYFAAITIGSNKNKIAQDKIINVRFNAIKTIALNELATYKNERNQIDEAIKLYALSGRVAEQSGDSEAAIKNVQYSVSLIYNLLQKLESLKQKSTQNSERELEFEEEIFLCRERIVNLLCDSAKRLSGEKISIDLYRRGIDEATILFKEKRLELDDYLKLLSGYWSSWGDVSDCAAYRLRAANLLALNGRFEEALGLLEKIPNDSVQAIEAVMAADRCFKQIRNKNSGDKNSADGVGESKDINVTKNELTWFKGRLRMDKSEWSEADVLTAMKMSEWLLYRDGFPIFYWESVDIVWLGEIELILNAALVRCKVMKSPMSLRLRASSIIASNLRGDYEKSAEVLKQINESGQVNLLTKEEQKFLRRFEVEFLAAKGEVIESIKILDGMLKMEPRNLLLLELKAEILSRQDSKDGLTESLRIWGLVGSITKEQSEKWWTARERIISIYVKQGNHAEAKKTYQRLKFLHPDFGNDSRKKRIEKLIENLEIL
jgi:hypothetical protein